jgi:hypothetical protein
MNAIPVGIFVLSIVLFLVIQSPLGTMMRPHHTELAEKAAEHGESALPPESAPASGVPRRYPRRRRKDVAPVMQVITSLVILGAALLMILSHEFDPKDKHWAYAAAGVVLGFWLKE